MKKKVRVFILEAIAKREMEEVEKIRNKGEEGQKEWHRMLKGEGRENVNGSELAVNEEKLRNREDIKMEIKRFWDEIGRGEEGEGVIEWNLEMEEIIMPEEEIRDLEREFTREEIREGFKKFKTGKAEGPDGTPNELYKEGGEEMISRLERIFNEVLRVERVPERWNESRVTLLFKGGHKSRKALKNYRPVAITNTIGKLFCGIVKDRLSRAIENCNMIGDE